MAADFVEDGAEATDGPFVSHAVAGEKPVVVLNIGDVVSDRIAENVGQFSAGFFENYLRAAGVPKFGTRRWVYVKIANLLGDQTDLKADRAALHFACNMEVGFDLRGYFAAVISRCRDVHFAIVRSL